MPVLIVLKYKYNVLGPNPGLWPMDGCFKNCFFFQQLIVTWNWSYHALKVKPWTSPSWLHTSFKGAYARKLFDYINFFRLCQKIKSTQTTVDRDIFAGKIFLSVNFHVVRFCRQIINPHQTGQRLSSYKNILCLIFVGTGHCRKFFSAQKFSDLRYRPAQYSLLYYFAFLVKVKVKCVWGHDKIAYCHFLTMLKNHSVFSDLSI